MRFLRWILSLFKKKPVEIISYGELPTVKETLTAKQIINAMDYYKKNTQRVQLIIQDQYTAVSVSDNDDKNNPRLWKAGHWLWFFNKHRTGKIKVV